MDQSQIKKFITVKEYKRNLTLRERISNEMLVKLNEEIHIFFDSVRNQKKYKIKTERRQCLFSEGEIKNTICPKSLE